MAVEAQPFKKCHMECDICGLDFLASSLKSYLENVHGVFKADVIGEEYLELHPGLVYMGLHSADCKF